MITGEQLKRITINITQERCNKLAELLNDACKRYNVNSFDEFDEFLANLFQESLECQHKSENMNYRAVTLMKVWPSRFPNITQAKFYERQPEKLANFVYGGRMGNNKPGDGHRFRGGGFIGLTGREVYTKYANYIGKEVGEAADLVRTTDYYALDSAFWFFYILKDLKDKAVKDDFAGIVKSINGGYIGMHDRQFYYSRIKNL